MTNDTDQVCLSQYEAHINHNTLYEFFFFWNCYENRVQLSLLQTASLRTKKCPSKRGVCSWEVKNAMFINLAGIITEFLLTGVISFLHPLHPKSVLQILLSLMPHYFTHRGETPQGITGWKPSISLNPSHPRVTSRFYSNTWWFYSSGGGQPVGLKGLKNLSPLTVHTLRVTVAYRFYSL